MQKQTKPLLFPGPVSPSRTQLVVLGDSGLHPTPVLVQSFPDLLVSEVCGCGCPSRLPWGSHFNWPGLRPAGGAGLPQHRQGLGCSPAEAIAVLEAVRDAGSFPCQANTRKN